MTIDPLLHLAGYFKSEADENAHLRTRLQTIEAENVRLREALKELRDAAVYQCASRASKKLMVEADGRLMAAIRAARALTPTQDTETGV